MRHNHMNEYLDENIKGPFCFFATTTSTVWSIFIILGATTGAAFYWWTIPWVLTILMICIGIGWGAWVITENFLDCMWTKMYEHYQAKRYAELRAERDAHEADKNG
jgi:hypothetical protein